jgi:hypothetical protein
MSLETVESVYFSPKEVMKVILKHFPYYAVAVQLYASFVEDADNYSNGEEELYWAVELYRFLEIENV